MDWTTLSSVATVATEVSILIGMIIVSRSRASKTLSDTQQSAINALQAELASLRNRVADTEKENTRLEHTLETIISALKTRGLVISVSGEMVSISDSSNGTSTTARIMHP